VRRWAGPSASRLEGQLDGRPQAGLAIQEHLWRLCIPMSSSPLSDPQPEPSQGATTLGGHILAALHAVSEGLLILGRSMSISSHEISDYRDYSKYRVDQATLPVRSRRTDAQALERDWRAVGDDLRRVLGK